MPPSGMQESCKVGESNNLCQEYTVLNTMVISTSGLVILQVAWRSGHSNHGPGNLVQPPSSQKVMRTFQQQLPSMALAIEAYPWRLLQHEGLNAVERVIPARWYCQVSPTYTETNEVIKNSSICSFCSTSFPKVSICSKPSYYAVTNAFFG